MVGQSVSLSWCRAPAFCLTVTVLSVWGALSDEKTGMSFVRVTVSNSKSVVSMFNIVTFYTLYMLFSVCIYAIYTRPLSVQAQYSRSCPISRLTNWLTLLTTSQHGPRRKHSTPLAVQFMQWKHACLRNRYLATAVFWLITSRSLPRNGSTCHSILHIVEWFYCELSQWTREGNLSKKNSFNMWAPLAFVRRWRLAIIGLMCLQWLWRQMKFVLTVLMQYFRMHCL
jgi:hypothetical protein